MIPRSQGVVRKISSTNCFRACWKSVSNVPTTSPAVAWTPPPIEQQKHSWEGMVLAPTAGTLDMRQAMYYSLSLPVSTVIIGCDSIPQLEQNVQLAREFTPLNQQQLAALTEKAQPVSKQSLFFRFYERA